MNKTNLLVRIDIFLLSIIFACVIALNMSTPFATTYFTLIAAFSCIGVFDIELEPKWWLPFSIGAIISIGFLLVHKHGIFTITINSLLWIYSCVTVLFYVMLKKKIGTYEIYTLSSLVLLTLLSWGDITNMIFRIFLIVGAIMLLFKIFSWLFVNKPNKESDSTSETPTQVEEPEQDFEQILKTNAENKQKEIGAIVEQIVAIVATITDIKKDGLLHKNIICVGKILDLVKEFHPFLTDGSVSYTLEQLITRSLRTTKEALDVIIKHRKILGDDDESLEQSLKLLKRNFDNLNKELHKRKANVTTQTSAHLTALTKLTDSLCGDETVSEKTDND